MKKIILTAIIFCFTSVFVHAQHEHKNATTVTTDTDSNASLSQLLTSYYAIKDALVAGNANLASAKAEDFLRAANGIDYKVISEGNINALVKDATGISEIKDIKKQREQFANLSNNLIALAKAMKLSDQPVYETYCPMKKAYWLSNSKTIKNPYFGSSMLTCGKVTQTIQ
jgi:hypothetical protein